MDRDLHETSLEELHHVADFIPGNFVVYRVVGTTLETLFYSPGVPALSGIDADEYDRLVGGDAVDAVAESDRGYVGRTIAECTATGETADCVYRIYHKDNGFVWVRANARMVGMLDGAPVLLSLFTQTADETMIYEALLDQLDLKIFVTDIETLETLYANRAARETMKVEGDAYIGEPCFRVQAGRDAVCPWCTIDKLEVGKTYEGEHASADGTVEEWTIRTRSKWSGHDAYLQFIDDITDQKRLQHELEQQKDTLQRIIDSLHAGISVFRYKDGVTTRIMANRFMYELKGISTDETLGDSGDELFKRVHPDDRARVKEEFEELFAGRGSMQLVYRTLCADGTYRWLHADGLAYAQEDGSILAYMGYIDTTDQHDAEQKLHEANEKYALAIDHAGLGIWEYIPEEHRIIEDYSVIEHRTVNKVIENFPEIMFETGMVHADSAESFRSFYRKVDEGVPQISGEFWLRDVRGEFRCERITYVTANEEDGHSKMFGIAQDITDLKRAEERYRKELEESRSLTDMDLVGKCHDNLTRNAIMEFTMKGGIPIAIPDGMTYDGACRTFIMSSIWEQDVPCVLETLDRNRLIERFKQGENQVKIEYKRFEEDGTPAWVSLVCNVFEEPHNGDIECFIYLYDITAAKLEQKITENLPRLGQIAIGTINVRSGTYRMFSSTLALDGFGHLPTWDFKRDMMWLSQHYVREDERDWVLEHSSIEAITIALEEDDVYSLYYDLPDSSDGNPHRHRAQMMYLDEGRDIVLYSHTDVTEQTIHEQKQIKRIAQALKEAEQANRAKSDFLGRVSHDIRTPMNIIYGMTDFAFKDIDDKQKLRGDLERIASANTFLLSLINDILDISKIESGQMELHPEPYPYGDFLENILGMFEPMCEQKGITFIVPDHGFKNVIEVDKVRFNQIVLNLLSNAVKYTPSGGTIEVDTDIERIEDGMVDMVISVQDTGIGIDPEFQKIMFEPFSQESGNDSPLLNQRGTGLGLAIVKRIVDLMDGTIDVASALDEGSRFTVRLRVPEATGADIEGDDAGDTLHDDLRGIERVLLVEDHPINAEIARRMLADAGIEAIWKENGVEGVRAFECSEEGEFDAVLMDIQMPQMNGYEAAREMRGSNRADATTIPIIAMTADAYVEDIQRCLEAGMNGHVSKPIDAKLLLAELRRAHRMQRGR